MSSPDDTMTLAERFARWHAQHSIQPRAVVLPSWRPRWLAQDVPSGGVDAERVDPVEAQESRPFWSVMMPAYEPKQPDLMRQALSSVLDQNGTHRPMEIVVVDDASATPIVGEIVAELSDRVRLHRNPQRLGLKANFNQCLERARGEVIHILHQDDLVYPGFYAAAERAYREHTEIGATVSRFDYIKADGRIWHTPPAEFPDPGVGADWLATIVAENRVQFAATTFRRAAVEAIGGFSHRLDFALDWELWARIAAHYPVHYDPERRAAFRTHGDSATEGLDLLHRLIDEMEAICLMAPLLPPSERRQVAYGSFRRLFLDKWQALSPDSRNPAHPIYRFLMDGWNDAALDEMVAAPAHADGPAEEREPQRRRWRRWPKRRARHKGFIDTVVDGVVEGWCWDHAHPRRHQELELWLTGRLADGTRIDQRLANVQADQYRADLEAHRIGKGDHCFRAPLPGWVSQEWGAELALSVRVRGSEFELENSPWTISTAKEIGVVERWWGGVISGWCRTGGGAVDRVAFRAADQVLGHADCLERRGDLAAHFDDHGRHQFTFVVPDALRRKDGMWIEVVEMKSGLPLTGSPVGIGPAERKQTGSSAPDESKTYAGRFPPARELAKRRCLFLDLTVPRDDVSAGGLAAFNEIALLQALGYEVTFVARPMLPDAPYTDRLNAMGVRCLHQPDWSSVHDVLARDGRFDLIYVMRFQMMEMVCESARMHQPDAKLIYHVADLHHLRAARRLAVDPSEENARKATREKQREIAMLRAADRVLVYSRQERDYLVEALPGIDVGICPWVVMAAPRAIAYEDTADLAFLGGFEHEPNLDGLRFFVREVMPHLRAGLPGVRLKVYGSHAGSEVRALAAEDVEIIGWVADIEEAFADCRVFVAPLRFGAGKKGKVAEALARGVPTVMTSIAAEGFELSGTAAAAVVDEPKAMARAISEIYGDRKRWGAMADAAGAFATEALSWSAGVRDMALALGEAGRQQEAEAEAVAPGAATAYLG